MRRVAIGRYYAGKHSGASNKAYSKLYLKFSWNDPILRGFFLHEIRRKAHCICIIEPPKGRLRQRDTC